MEAILQQILAEVKSVKSDVESIKSEVETIKHDVEAIKISQARLESRMDNLESRMDKLEENQKNMQADLTEIGRKVGILYGQTADLSEYRTETREAIAKVEIDIRLMKKLLAS